MKIYIIRHGETTANAEGVFQGWTDNQLNEKGIELAGLTGRELTNVRFDLAVSSPLQRARQTAEIVLRASGSDCAIETDDRLKEMHMGEWEGKKFRPGEREVDAESCRTFFQDPLAVGRLPGGESVRDVMVRSQEFLRDLARREEYENVLVSTHGCTLRAMLNFLYDDPGDFWQGHVPYNCVVSIVEALHSEFKLLAMDKVYYDQSFCVDRFSEF